MAKSVYIQRKRTRGFNLQAASPDGRPVVSCTRGRHAGSVWRNYFKVKEYGPTWALFWNDDDKPISPLYASKEDALKRAVNSYAAYHNGPLYRKAIRDGLHGHHLSCWCAPGTPCHVQDVLLPILNGEEPRTY